MMKDIIDTMHEQSNSLKKPKGIPDRSIGSVRPPLRRIDHKASLGA